MLTQEVIDWSRSIRQHLSAIDIQTQMRNVGWNETDIAELMRQEFNLQPIVLNEETVIEFPHPYVNPDTNKIQLSDRTVNCIASIDSPKVWIFDKFLTDQECDEIIRIADERLERSTVTESQTGGSVIENTRTSDGMFIQKYENDFIQKVDSLIEEITRWPVQKQEPLQVLRYNVGGEYTSHNDYFNENDPGTKALTATSGNRVGTFLIYLSDVEEGGATLFTDIGLKVKPRKGCAAMFSYPQPNSTSKTLHAGMPVTKGVKWLGVKWMRKLPF